MVMVRSTRMRNAGSSAPVGFQDSLGEMGNVSKLTARRAM